MKIKTLILYTVLVFILLSQSGAANGADEYISHPSNIPLFDNFKTTQIEPGNSGKFTFTIENRYEEDMKNVTLTAGIYGMGTSYFYKNIEDVDHPPTIKGGDIEHIIYLPDIGNDTLIYVNFTIKSHSESTQGTYFLRFNLSFEYNNTLYVMKSKGYFTDEEWDSATSLADEEDPGRIDIDVLGVDGIIPDSSFQVKNPIPVWPLYVCLIPLIVLLGILALLFYCQEQYNMFPWLDKGFKYWSGKLHQSWRLLKHRFRKA